MMASSGYRSAAAPPALGTPTQLAAGMSLAGSGSVASSSFTPTAEAMVYCVVASRRGTQVVGAHTIADDLVVPSVWTPILAAGPLSDGGTDTLRLTVFRTPAGASPAARIVTVGCNPSNHLGAYLFEIANATADASNTAVDDDLAGDPSVTLPSSPDASSTTVAAWVGKILTLVGDPVPVPSGYTELAEFTGGTAIRVEVAYKAGNTTPAVAWTTPQGYCYGAAFEVKNQ